MEPRFQELEQQARRHALERRKLADERNAFAKQRQEYEDWQKIQADRRRNPVKYLSQDYGDDWYDKLTQIRVNGAPTSDLIISEVDEREKKMRAEWDEREGKLRAELKERDERDAARSKQMYEQQAVDHVRQNFEKYPLLNHFEEWGTVPRAIEEHFIATSKTAPDGSLVPGELWTAEQAAKHLEERMTALEKRFTERAAKAAKPKSPTTEPPPQQRRTMTTDMTASTSGDEWSPPKDESERLRRSLAAWDRTVAMRNGA